MTDRPDGAIDPETESRWLRLEAIEVERSIEAIIIDLIERAVRSLFAQPDRELALLSRQGGSWPEIVRMSQEAYGYAPPRVRRFHPTPRDMEIMLPVWDWLVWLKKQDEQDYHLVVGRAVGLPWHILAGRYGVSEKQATRYHEAAIDRLVAQFEDEAKKIA